MQSETVHLSRLAENTSRYARYSRSAGGLSLVIGGVLCLAAFVIGAAVELTPAWRYTLVAAPLLWLASKELLRSEENTSEIQSLMRTSYAVFSMKTKKTQKHKKQ